MSSTRARTKRRALKAVPLDTAALEAIERFARVMARCGFAANSVAQAFERAMAAVHYKAAPVQSGPRLREIPEAPHLLTLWCSNPDYVDERGTPYRLPARGPRRSLEALVRRVNRSLDLDEVLRYLLRTNTIRKVGKMYALHRRWILLRGVHGSAHSRILRGLVGMLRTLEHNLVSRTDAGGWFEFTAENPRFPVSQLPAFEGRARREGLGLLRKLDLFMQACEAARDPAEPTIWLGIGMHRFQEDLTDPPSPRVKERSTRSPAYRRSRRRRRSR
jgi:hypothetical protein